MILLIGASASGKTEIAKALFRLHGIKKAVTHTSRPIRPSETPDVDYHFVTEEEVLRLKEEGEFVETTDYNGKHYGSSKKEVADDKVLIVDPKGLEAYLSLHDPRIISFYLLASDATRRARMQGRGDDPESVTARLKNDAIDFSNPILEKADFTIETEGKEIDDLAEMVYFLYQRTLQSR